MVLFRSVPVFEVTALLKKGSPIYRKTATYRAFHTFSEYVFSMCTAVSAVPEMSCCFGSSQSRKEHHPLPFALTHLLYA